MGKMDPLAALDAAIEALPTALDTDFGHLWTPVEGPVSKEKPLSRNGLDTVGHFGHPKQVSKEEAQIETHEKTHEHERGDPKILYSGVQGVQGVQSVGTQGSIFGHLASAGVQSVQSVGTQGFSEEGGASVGVQGRPTPPAGDEPDGDTPAAWRAWCTSRLDRHRLAEPDEGRALCRTYGDAQDAWHRRHGGTPDQQRCAGCGKPLGSGERFVLNDGVVVHWHKAAGLECLTAYGRLWRAAAQAGLRALGIEPPHGWAA